MMEKKNYVVAVDFGSSNLVMTVGTKDESTGLMKVEALVSRPSAGIDRGVIQNINSVSDVLRSLKADIEAELGISISEAYVGVSGDFIRYERYADHVFVSDRKNNVVSQADVESLHNRMNEVVVPEDDEVLDRFPLNYVVDPKIETETPVGAISRQLSSTFAFIISKKSPLGRLAMVFENSGLRIAGIFANSAVNAEAVLSVDERSDGAAVIDIGGNTTDVTVVCGKQVRYAATIPLGGDAINSDINKHGVPLRNVESLKRQCGTALSETVPENKGLKIKVSGNINKTVMKRNLASIIEARLTDIIEFVKEELKISGYESNLPFGLVLTGGSASIPDIDILFSRLTGREVRIATASEGIDEASCSKIDSPEFTSAIAVLLAGGKKGECHIEVCQTDSQPAQPEKPSVPKPQTETAYRTPAAEKAHTYTPPQHSAPQPPKPQVWTPPQPPKPQPEPEVKEPEQTAAEKQKPKDEGTKEQAVEQPKRGGGLFNRVFNKLNDVFINGEDEYADTPLDNDAAPRYGQPSGKSRIHPKKDFGSDFFVEGEDKEEL